MSDLSPSLFAKTRNQPNDLCAIDMVAAAIVHVLVVTIIALLMWWQQSHHTEPMKRIEVRMISAAELDKLLKQPAPEKPRPEKKTPPPTPAKQLKAEKPVKQPPVQKLALPKPAAKQTSHQAKAKPKVEENFDPFAPIESSSKPKTTAKTSKGDIVDMVSQQLSQQEVDRYIAMMQSAVQRQWKVPADIAADTPDPLVEMVLNPDGSVNSVRIIESSGLAALDQTLVQAIYAAAPFQLPREQFTVFQSNHLRFHPLK